MDDRQLTAALAELFNGLHNRRRSHWGGTYNDRSDRGYIILVYLGAFA